MNRFVQKLIAGAAAVAIAVTGLLGGAPVAKAADPVQGTIKITNAENDSVEHTLFGWKLASLKNVDTDANSNLTFLIDTNDALVGEIEASMTKDQLEAYKKDANYYTENGKDNNPIGWLVASSFKDIDAEPNDPWGGDASALRTFATTLSKNLAKDGAPNADKSDFKSSATGYENTCDQGLWLLKDTAVDSTAQSIPIIVATKLAGYSTETNDWGNVTLKMNVPTVGKKITKSVTGTVADGGFNADALIGGKVEYELSSVIPTYTGYEMTKPARVFKLIDTASKGLTVGEGSVKSVTLKKNDDAKDCVTLDEGTDYTVMIDDYKGTDSKYTGGHVTTIDLEKYVNMDAGSKSETEGKIREGYTVVVKFEATVNKDAVIASVGNPNSVELQYSRTPNNDFTKISGPTVHVYTYDFGILKTDMAGDSIKSTKDLKGAQFVIARVNGNAETFMAKNADSGADPGAWSDLDAMPAVDATNGVFTTDAYGKIAMSGLPAGTYHVYEIKAPTGYTNIGLPDFTFTIGSDIDPSSNIAKVTYTKKSDSDGGRVSFDKTTPSQANVKNAKNLTELPLTGDLGIKVFITVGVLLMAAGAAFALSARMRA